MLQDLGSVRDPREGGHMNRENLDHLLKEYARRFADKGLAGDAAKEGVRITWRPWVALLQKSA